MATVAQILCSVLTTLPSLPVGTGNPQARNRYRLVFMRKTWRCIDRSTLKPVCATMSAAPVKPNNPAGEWQHRHGEYRSRWPERTERTLPTTGTYMSAKIANRASALHDPASVSIFRDSVMCVHRLFQMEGTGHEIHLTFNRLFTPAEIHSDHRLQILLPPTDSTDGITQSSIVRCHGGGTARRYSISLPALGIPAGVRACEHADEWNGKTVHDHFTSVIVQARRRGRRETASDGAL